MTEEKLRDEIRNDLTAVRELLLDRKPADRLEILQTIGRIEKQSATAKGDDLVGLSNHRSALLALLKTMTGEDGEVLLSGPEHEKRFSHRSD